MSQRIELELDTPAELLLKAMARLGWAGLMVLAAIWAAKPGLSLAGPLALTGFLALGLSLLAWALQENYVLDLEQRKLLYVSRFFTHVREQAYPFEEIVASSLLTTGRLAAPCLLTRAGQVLRVGDFDLKPGASRVRALQLAEQIGCEFSEPPERQQAPLGERVYLAWSLALVAWFLMIAVLVSRS